MKERILTVTLEKARKWYNSDNDSLKELALQAFTKDELRVDFRNIKSLRDACEILNLSYNDILVKSNSIKDISKKSDAMFKLNIVKRALNLGQDLHLTKDPKNSYLYYPFNPFITKNSSYYKRELDSGEMVVIGLIKNEGKEYYLLGGYARAGGTAGFGCFHSYDEVGDACAYYGFLGCASKEIAEHFSRYFGVLITEAKYGDLEGVEIININ